MKNVKMFLIIIVAVIEIVNAKSEQLLALTGGLNGFGVKYSLLVNRFGLDVGFPFLYRYEHYEYHDTVKNNHKFECNSYFDIKFNFVNQKKFDFEVGLMLFSLFSFNGKSSMLNDSTKAQSIDFGYNMSIGPVIEYSYKGNTMHKIFGIQFAPFYLDRGHFDLKVGLQLNYYFKRSNEEPIIND